VGREARPAVLATTRIRAAARGFLVAAGPCGDGWRRSRGTIDGSAHHPDRSRMPRRPRSEWLARAVTMALHLVAALLGRDALWQLVGVARDALRPRAELVAENVLLRQQLLVLRRQVDRPRLTRRDRWWMVAAARVTKTWEMAPLIVQPAILLRWHREMYRWWWPRRSKARREAGSRVAADTIALIRRMTHANRRLGAERIRGELLKLGLRVCKRTVQKYMRGVRPPRPSSPRWGDLPPRARQGDLGLRLPAAP
jgi:hypothetical protein